MKTVEERIIDIIEEITCSDEEHVDAAKPLNELLYESEWVKFTISLLDEFPKMHRAGKLPHPADIDLWLTINDVAEYIHNLGIATNEDEPSTPTATTTAVANPLLTKMRLAIMLVKPLLGPENIRPESKLLMELGITEGDLEDIVTNLEEELGAHARHLFTTSEIKGFKTVQDIMDALEWHQAAEAQATAIMTTTEA